MESIDRCIELNKVSSAKAIESQRARRLSLSGGMHEANPHYTYYIYDYVYSTVREQPSS